MTGYDNFAQRKEHSCNYTNKTTSLELGPYKNTVIFVHQF